MSLFFAAQRDPAEAAGFVHVDHALVAAIDKGFPQMEISDAAYRFQQQIDVPQIRNLHIPFSNIEIVQCSREFANRNIFNLCCIKFLFSLYFIFHLTFYRYKSLVNIIQSCTHLFHVIAHGG